MKCTFWDNLMKKTKCSQFFDKFHFSFVMFKLLVSKKNQNKKSAKLVFWNSYP